MLIRSFSDIQKLNDLECFVTLPGDYPVTRLKLKFRKRPLVADALVERDIITSLDPEVEMQLVAVESDERKAVQALFDAPAQDPVAVQGMAPQQTAGSVSPGEAVKTALKEVSDRETGEVQHTENAPPRALDVSVPVLMTSGNGTPPDDETGKPAAATAAASTGGGREKTIPITRSPVTTSPEAPAQDDQATYEQYAQSTAQSAMAREEREFVPASGHEPEM